MMLQQVRASTQQTNLLYSVCTELRRRLESGQECRAEDFLADHPDLASDPDLAAGLIRTECEVRRRLGQSIDLRAVMARFPHLADHLGFLLVDQEEPGPDVITVADNPNRIKPHHELPFQSLDHYELGERLGQGGMGVVFKAWDPALRRNAALKMMRGGFSADPLEIARFQREARAAARLRHPNIVPIHGLGSFRGEPCFAMALLEGGTLASRTSKFREPKAAAAMTALLARAVHYAHLEGVLHRDLKPANIFFDERGNPLIGDFGLAKIADENVALSHDGAFTGTPAYMAPEQFPGSVHSIGPQADLWALGVILCELAIGKRPFSGRSWRELVDQVSRPQTIQDVLSASNLDPDLRTIVQRCLMPDPADRYASANELADDLDCFVRGEALGCRPVATKSRVARGARVRKAAVVPVLLLLCVLSAAASFIPGTDATKQTTSEKRLVLIGDKGAVRDGIAHDVVFDGGPIGPHVGPDGCFQIPGAKECGVLFEAPGSDRFRFETEMRIERSEGNPVARAGVIFGHHRFNEGKATYQSYCSLLFTEHGDRPGSVWLLLQAKRNDGEVKEGRYRILDQSVRIETAADRSPWRKVVLEVDPQRIRWRLLDIDGNEDASGTLPVSRIEQAPEPVAFLPDFKRPPGVAQRVGLYVPKGQSAFRRTVLTTPTAP